MMMAFIISCRPRLDCSRAWDDDRLDQDSEGVKGISRWSRNLCEVGEKSEAYWSTD